MTLFACDLYYQLDPLQRGISGECHGCRRCLVAGMSTPRRTASFSRQWRDMEEALAACLDQDGPK